MLDDALVPITPHVKPMFQVSILVMLDDALVHAKGTQREQSEGLNPCYAGRCSST